jgi:hypothetical protein
MADGREFSRRGQASGASGTFSVDATNGDGVTRHQMRFISNIALRQQRWNWAVLRLGPGVIEPLGPAYLPSPWPPPEGGGITLHCLGIFVLFGPERSGLGLCQWHVFRVVVDRWLKRGGEASGRSSSQSGTFVGPDQSGLRYGRFEKL